MRNNGLLEELQQEYEQRRLSNYAIFLQRQTDACQKCQGLQELLENRHNLVMNGIRSGILHTAPYTPSIDTANAMVLLNEQIRQKLKEGGLPEDYLKPVYTCPVCKDEGFVYDPQRRMCECYTKALSSKLLLQNVNPNHTFEAFDSSVFSHTIIEGMNVSQQGLMLRNKAFCEGYADNYPQNQPKNLLLMGSSGLGKTFLMECIAHRIAERGYLPIYTSAYRLQEALRQAFFENNRELLNDYLEAELLMIDDLGTEPLMNNVTIEQLFNLLNERMLHGLHTVISTNFNANTIMNKYSERISSRLLDTLEFRQIKFYGNDIRDKKGG